MYRAVLALVVGLILSLSGGASSFAQGDVIWEGTQESKLFSLTGPKKIRITTEGVFINGSFKPAWRLSKNDACLYGISNFPDSGYFSTSKVWNSVLRKFDFSECSSIRDRAKYSHIFERTFSTRVKKSPVQGTNASNVTSPNNQQISDRTLCVFAVRAGKWDTRPRYIGYVNQAKSRGLTCGIEQSMPTQLANNLSTNAELIAAEARAAELEKRLALLEAEDELVQRQIASDNQAPTLTIIQSGANGREGYLTGSVADNVEIAEVLVDGAPVSVAANGSFEWSGFVPTTGKDIIVEAIDTAALSSRQVVRIERGQITQAIGPMFADLNPMAGRRVLQNKNALALIVGISDYERTDAPAIYADKDAQYFHDYASLKLGIPDQNITTLVNDKAEQGDVYLAVVDWLRRSSKPRKSDVFIFFAGHGLASQDGEQMYLLPFDGRPRLLDKTAILRDELFSDIAAANPRSVTVFLDTCYSGTTRGPDMLIASRPIAIRAKEQAVPEGFTVMTAAAGDQTAKPLEEAKHGMFSYFLMKGMEGDADTNQDNQITAGELHAYVQQNVIQQSSGSQTPELQGDADRVLVRFQ